MNRSRTDGAALAVKTTGLTKEFGTHKALDGVGLAVPRGVDLVYDHVGGNVLLESLALTRKGGRIVTCGAHAGETVPLDVIELFRAERSTIGSRTCTPRELGHVIALVAEGKLDPVVDSIHPLSDAAAAYQKLRRRDHFGKIILQPKIDT